MAYSERTIKRLFARSQNVCAMPHCKGPIVVGETVVGEICHIRARRKKGPRFDASLTPAARNDYENLLLLCRTCHKLVDSQKDTYTIALLSDIKAMQERTGGIELDPVGQKSARILYESLRPRRRASATARDQGVAISVAGDNYGNIRVSQAQRARSGKTHYPANSIGADANLCGYVDYLFGLAVDYWKGVDAMNPGRLGRKIKTRFRLKQRTRNHISVDRFDELVDFMIRELLEPSPAGKRHRRNGTKLCRTFDEFRAGPFS